MSNYDFSTLGPLDFEKLVCDLLNDYIKDKKPNRLFKSSKEGKDKGIDLFLSTPENDLEIVAQVKHYVKSPYSKLRYDLINKEKEKVAKLNPKSYVFVTSLELSPQEKIEIKSIFKPYIISLEDVFDRNDLNMLIRKNKKIEENHFKLWFSSFVVLNKILNYRYEGRNKEFTEEILARKIRLFVLTSDFYRVKMILENNKFIVLTGEPGVGKTTLSDMVIYNYLKEDFQLTIIYDDIKEIENTLLNDDSKQIFYFDDFLGHTQAEINKSKSAENILIKLIGRIEGLKNKFLILNTRKFILSTFLEESERFRNFNPLRAEAKIELSTYSYGAKRRMLDNHIAESNLNDKQLEVINSLTTFICRHKNFTPRIIDFFTGSIVLGFNPTDYKDFILANLENPKEIWSHAYSIQIYDCDRLLLNTLFSLGGESSKNQLEIAYNERLDYETKFNNFKKPLNSFNESLRKLNDGFIVVNNYRYNQIGFINPSLEDFLKFYITENSLEIERIIYSSAFVQQWYYFYKPYTSLKSDVDNKLSNNFEKYSSRIINDGTSDEDLFLIFLFGYYFAEESSNQFIVEILLKINNWEFLGSNYSTFEYSKKFLNQAKSNSIINNVVSKFHWSFLFNFLMSETLIEDLIETSRLFIRHYAFDLKELLDQVAIDNEEEVDLLISHFKYLFKEEAEKFYSSLGKNTEQDAHFDFIRELEVYHQFIQENIYDKFSIDLRFLSNPDWNLIAFNNMTEGKYYIEPTYKDFENEADYEMDYHYDYDDYEEYYRNEEKNISYSVDLEADEEDIDLPF